MTPCMVAPCWSTATTSHQKSRRTARPQHSPTSPIKSLYRHLRPLTHIEVLINHWPSEVGPCASRGLSLRLLALQATPAPAEPHPRTGRLELAMAEIAFTALIKPRHQTDFAPCQSGIISYNSITGCCSCQAQRGQIPAFSIAWVGVKKR